MQNDPLAQLRDIHLPVEPSWWPPAAGWWLIAILGIAALVWATRWAHNYHRRRRPIRLARREFADLDQAYKSGQLGASVYINATNKLLKRVLIHGYSWRSAVEPSGAAWLQLLDQLSGDQAFSQGPGQVLGDARFQAHALAPTADFAPLIDRFLSMLPKQLNQQLPTPGVLPT